ncbi:hypothetical protein SLEP1_g50902 [Rubroshorea leprosula]|uniref:ATP synthase F0 subunit 8 n=1 Tax=Rubroshorea leprosula TaxID=152421 RepID=A0AAV5M1H9_9ROSI|nr:hypothetical protein SLEP1_g50902 [Rubroshorea leprosula]
MWLLHVFHLSLMLFTIYQYLPSSSILALEDKKPSNNSFQ